MTHTDDDIRAETRLATLDEVLNDISEVYAYAQSHKWGARAERALAAAALKVTGTYLWHMKSEQDQATVKLDERWAKVKAEFIRQMEQSLGGEKDADQSPTP